MKKIFYIVIGAGVFVIIAALVWRYLALAPTREYATEVDKIMEKSVKLPVLDTKTLEKQIPQWEKAKTQKTDVLVPEMSKIKNTPQGETMKKFHQETLTHLDNVEKGYGEIRDLKIILDVIKIAKIENTSDPKAAQKEILDVAKEMEDYMKNNPSSGLTIGPEYKDLEEQTRVKFDAYGEAIGRAYLDAQAGKDISYLNDSYKELEDASTKLTDKLETSIRTIIKNQKTIFSNLRYYKSRFI